MKGSSIYKELSASELNLIVGRHLSESFEAKVLTGGMFNTTYLITTLPEKKKYVLRMGPVNRHLLLPFEQNLMEAENYFYQLCSGIDVAIPTITALDLSRNLIDRDYMITEYIESCPLSEVKVEEDEKYSLYKKTGEYAKAFHQIKANRFGRLADVKNGKGFEKWSDYLKSEISDMAVFAKRYSVYSDSEISTAIKLFEYHTPLIDEITQPNLVHADLWAGNVLISDDEDKRRVVAIIDADRAIFGDTDLELASGWMVNDAFIDGYGSSLDMNEKSVTRRKLYSLFFNLIDSIVCKVEYNNDEGSQANKNTVIKLLTELNSNIT